MSRFFSHPLLAIFPASTSHTLEDNPAALPHKDTPPGAGHRGDCLCLGDDSITADAFGWDRDATPAPMGSCDTTPTPQAARHSSPASAVEIAREDFPQLEAPAPAAVAKTHGKVAKGKKGKGKAKDTTAAAPATHDSDTEDHILAADLARATAASLGAQTLLDHATAGATSSNAVTATRDRDAEDPFFIADLELATAASLAEQAAPVNATAGASSSHRPDTGPGSPPKRLHANTAGDAAPAPFAVGAAAQVATPAATPAQLVPASATFAQAVIAAPTAPLAAAAPAQPPAAAPAQPVAAAALPPMWLTADGLPPRGSYTPTPAGGFHAIIYSPELLLQGVPPDLIQMYDAVPFPKIFLVVSGGNGAVMRTHGLIRDAIGNYINIDPTGFTLGTPDTLLAQLKFGAIPSLLKLEVPRRMLSSVTIL
ncbi:hypothetical protein B0H10DRAFT_2221658 [Mycena sp. CBHHK59/15]|nr:hypothetical protein B0H10DRAFT_2221658 [Mycena sp. CBHHK59/15]